MTTKPFNPQDFHAPDTFPLLFHEVVADGGGDLTSARWKGESLRKRFRYFIAALRHSPSHQLHIQASTHEWMMAQIGDSWFVTSRVKKLLKKA